ncbi:MAG: ABC transporter permease [Cyclobacteriaceae bacterium]
MIRSYFIIALRNLAKHKAFSVINIVGLTVGVACCLLLMLYIKAETGYDRHHQHAGELYRITTAFHNMDGINDHIATSSPPIAMAMPNDFPEVVNATRIVNPPGVDQNLIQYGEKALFETGGLLVDSTFFSMFDYAFVEGKPEKALSKPNTVVLAQELADKLFGRTDVLGEIISIGNNMGKYDYQVTGVIRKTDRKTHIDANFFTSMESEGLGTFVAHNDQWAGQNFVFSYIQLNPASTPEALEAKLPDFLNKYGAENFKALGINKTLHLQPVTNIHLKSNYDHELGQNGSIVYVYVLSAIAAFILLIACINFMNLSTAKASQRASEVGVRKTLGASRSGLVRQFLSESMLIVLIAVLLGGLLVEILLPYFNSLTGKNISFLDIHWSNYALAALGLTLVTGLLAGAYPAFYLSSFQPARVLKGKVVTQLSSGMLRKALVVFQFVIAICLISGVIIIVSQLDYMREQTLGFDATSRVVVPLRTPEVAEQYPALKTQLSQQAEIRQISASSVVPGQKILNDVRLYPAGSTVDNGIYCQRYFMDEGLVETLGLTILAGRSLNWSTVREDQILINQLALANLGIPLEQAIGEKVYFNYEEETIALEIIGVVNDFHQLSLHQPIVSTIFHPGKASDFHYMVAEVHPAGMQQALQAIENAWKETVSVLPFEYTLLDQDIQQQYESDRRMSQIISSFTLVAILISCLGLYGLSAFVAERKVKEIGVRKVLGAKVSSIVRLLSQDFTKLVLIAFLISIPLSYYMMKQWLQNFAYQIDIGPQFFIIAGLMALLIAWGTISYHAIRAARANPVKSLRSE